MKKISQEDAMNMAFILSINKEELLIKKYENYYKQTNNKEIKQVIKELKKESKEHLRMMRELMSNLNIQINGRVVK